VVQIGHLSRPTSLKGETILKIVLASAGGHNPSTNPSAVAGVPVGASTAVGDLGGGLWSPRAAASSPRNSGLGENSLAEEPLWNHGLWASEWDLLPDLAGRDWPAAASTQANRDVLQVCCGLKA
jgi:hypothetical protein